MNDDQTSRPKVLPAHDAAAALESAGGDAALADELFATLLAELPAEVQQLRACVEESDWTALAEHAHQVRGATGYCGVAALDDAIEALERAARLCDPLLVSTALAAVELEASRLAAAARV
jgi:HPt (histidine-containing phosphotransfer) domain-containing protein